MGVNDHPTPPDMKEAVMITIALTALLGIVAIAIGGGLPVFAARREAMTTQ